MMTESARELRFNDLAELCEHSRGGETVVDLDALYVDQLAGSCHQPGRHLGATDVNCKNDVHQRRRVPVVTGSRCPMAGPMPWDTRYRY